MRSLLILGIAILALAILVLVGAPASAYIISDDGQNGSGAIQEATSLFVTPYSFVGGSGYEMSGNKFAGLWIYAQESFPMPLYFEWDCHNSYAANTGITSGKSPLLKLKDGAAVVGYANIRWSKVGSDVFYYVDFLNYSNPNSGNRQILFYLLDGVTLFKASSEYSDNNYWGGCTIANRQGSGTMIDQCSMSKPMGPAIEWPGQPGGYSNWWPASGQTDVFKFGYATAFSNYYSWRTDKISAGNLTTFSVNKTPQLPGYTGSSRVRIYDITGGNVLIFDDVTNKTEKIDVTTMLISSKRFILSISNAQYPYGTTNQSITITSGTPLGNGSTSIPVNQTPGGSGGSGGGTGTTTNPSYSLFLSPWTSGAVGIPYVSCTATCTDDSYPFDRVVWYADGVRSQTTSGAGVGGLLDYTEFQKQSGTWKYLTESTGVWTSLQAIQPTAFMYDTAYFKSAGKHTVTAVFYNGGVEIARCDASITLYEAGDYASVWINVIDARYGNSLNNAVVCFYDQFLGNALVKSQILNKGGSDLFTLVKGHNYKIIANASGYINYTEYFVWPSTSSVSHDIPMTLTNNPASDPSKVVLTLYCVDSASLFPIKSPYVSWYYSGTGAKHSARGDVNGVISLEVDKSSSVVANVMYDSQLWNNNISVITVGESSLVYKVYITQKNVPWPTATPSPIPYEGVTPAPGGSGGGGSSGGSTLKPEAQAGQDDALNFISTNLPALVMLFFVGIVFLVVDSLSVGRGKKK